MTMNPSEMSHGETYGALRTHEPHGNCPVEPCDWHRAVVKRQIDTDPELAEFDRKAQLVDTTGRVQNRHSGLQRPDAGHIGGNQYGPCEVRSSTDKQSRFLASLLKQRNTATATVYQLGVLRRASEQLGRGAVNKRTASDALDILLTMPEHSEAPKRTATEGQVRFFTSLLDQRVALPGMTLEAFQALTPKGASDVLDTFKAQPYKPREAREELEAGIYLHDGEIFKVQRAVHGSGNMYAKRLTVIDGTGTFEFAGGMVRKLKADERMTLDQAREYGAVYGVCCNCGRTLTDETSIEAGIGPVCAKRFA